MSEPFLAEVRIVGFDFPPRGWAYCDGQILPISQNQSLYSLLGTTYGGNGRTDFALPDLRGRTPFHVGDGFQLGHKGGEETVTLSEAQMAAHDHQAQATSTDADSSNPNTSVYLGANPSRTYKDPTSLTALRSDAIGATGGGQGHNNMQPYLTLSFCIALRGLFPSRN